MSHRTFRRLVAAGEIQVIGKGAATRIPMSELEGGSPRNSTSKRREP
jgi:hypothetical protein